MTRSIESREYWEQKAGCTHMSMCEKVLSLINNTAQHEQDFNFQTKYISFQSKHIRKGNGCNFLFIRANRNKPEIAIYCRVHNKESWKQALQKAGLRSKTTVKNRAVAYISHEDFGPNLALITELITSAVKESNVGSK